MKMPQDRTASKKSQDKSKDVSTVEMISSPNISGTKNGGTHLYELYVGLMWGKTHPQNTLIRFSTSGTWNFWWLVVGLVMVIIHLSTGVME